MTSLDFERIMLVGAGGFKRMFEELVICVKGMKRGTKPLQEDPQVRRKLADIATKIEICYLLFWTTAEALDKGLMPSVEASMAKLIATELSGSLAEAAMDIFGPYGLLEGDSPWTPFRGLSSWGFLDSVSATIGAGTSEIQRNIIATRGLGLPRK